MRGEIEWGPTGGRPWSGRWRPSGLRRRLPLQPRGGKAVVIVDRPQMRAVFGLFGGPRGLSRMLVHGAYKPLLKSRGDGG